MRHLLADACRINDTEGAHLSVTAKVQIFSERSNSGARAERVRRGSQPNGNMIAIPAVRMANCQRGETPTMHKL